jgi:hypothetical protein
MHCCLVSTPEDAILGFYWLEARCLIITTALRFLCAVGDGDPVWKGGTLR